MAGPTLPPFHPSHIALPWDHSEPESIEGSRISQGLPIPPLYPQQAHLLSLPGGKSGCFERASDGQSCTLWASAFSAPNSFQGPIALPCPRGPASLCGAFVKVRERCSVWAEAACARTYHPLTPPLDPLYSEHPVQLGPSSPCALPSELGPLYPGGSHRVAGRALLFLPLSGSLEFPPDPLNKPQLPTLPSSRHQAVRQG